MQKIFNVVMIFAVGAVCGMLVDSHMMANDAEFHDYWMKRSKKN